MRQLFYHCASDTDLECCLYFLSISPGCLSNGRIQPSNWGLQAKVIPLDLTYPLFLPPVPARAWFKPVNLQLWDYWSTTVLPLNKFRLRKISFNYPLFLPPVPTRGRFKPMNWQLWDSCSTTVLPKRVLNVVFIFSLFILPVPLQYTCARFKLMSLWLWDNCSTLCYRPWS